MKQGDSIKLVIAIVILVAAGILIAWNFGVFSGGSTTTPSDTTTPNAPVPGQPRTAPGVNPSSSGLTPALQPLA